MAEIPEEIALAAAKASSAHFAWCDYGETWRDCERCVRIFEVTELALKAAAPLLAKQRRVKPRMDCPVCSREVVKRDDGRPIAHYPPNGRTHLTCGGMVSDRCRGGCRCKKHR